LSELWRPIAADELPGRVAGWLAEAPGIVRVAVDGAPASEPEAFAAALVPELERAGRPVALIRADTFWRDASLRLEYGREDVEAYLNLWLDADALRREVLAPVAVSGRYLPSLRDPATNRATRQRPAELGPGGVLIVAGSLLLGRGLPFDRTVHLHLSSGALARRMPAELAWTVPAFQRYGVEVAPSESADLVVKVDDVRHPAVRGGGL
jgi:hypothetical protein